MTAISISIPIIISIISFFANIILTNKKIKEEYNNNEKIRQDEQTDWVKNLVKVCETPSEIFGEKEILVVERCLRLYKYEEDELKADDNKWKAFTNLWNSTEKLFNVFEKEVESETNGK